MKHGNANCYVCRRAASHDVLDSLWDGYGYYALCDTCWAKYYAAVPRAEKAIRFVAAGVDRLKEYRRIIYKALGKEA